MSYFFFVVEITLPVAALYFGFRFMHFSISWIGRLFDWLS